MEEVIPGIFHISLPLPNPDLDHINTYLVRGESECLLIDTGWNTPEVFGSLEAQLAEIGVGFGDISQIVVTHVHPDHYGLAGRLKQFSSARVALHHLETEFIESRYINMEVLLTRMAKWLRINGVPDEELAELRTASIEMVKWVVPVLPDIVLNGGETISLDSFHFQVLWTPGHSIGHIALYEPQRKLLISGDLVLPNITPNVGLHPQSVPNPLQDYLSSLNAVKKLDVSLVLPGHEYLFTNLKQRVEQITRHHQRRNSKILKILDTTPGTAYQIARNIVWGGTNSASWDELGPWDRRMAVMEAMAHLEAMRAEGRVDRFTRGDMVHYQRGAM
ncbi:MBL fold metallo-hydrolase [Chloroflexota bacterium]